MTAKWFYACAIVMLLLLPKLAAAQPVVQSGSKITFPAEFDGMAVRAANGAFPELASAYSYQNNSDRIEVHVFRASYPSVGLWFIQGDRQTNDLFSKVMITPASSTEIFAAKSNRPNGMRRFYNVDRPFVSTAIAVLGFGQWIVSIRSSSKTLNVEEQRARLDKIIQQIEVPSSIVDSRYPVALIADCIRPTTLALGPEDERPLAAVTLELRALGGLGAMLTSRDAFAGDNGLAAQPSTYCRRQSVSGKTIWFETVDAVEIARWVVPIGETGITVEAITVPNTHPSGKVEMLGVLITNDLMQSSVRSVYRQLPHPVGGVLRGLATMFGGEEPYASVKYGTNELTLSE